MTNEDKAANPHSLPTIVCSWCKEVLRIGAPQISHGICRPCAGTFLEGYGRSRGVLPA